MFQTEIYAFRTFIRSLRKHPFLLALRRWGRFAAAKSEEKRMFSQANSFVAYVAFSSCLRREDQFVVVFSFPRGARREVMPLSW